MIPLRWKILICTLLAIVVAEGFYIAYKNKHPVKLGLYSFNDNVNGYVMAEGTWISDTPLAYPMNANKLECWRDMGYCIETTAQVAENGLLSVITTYWKILEWGADRIIVEDDSTPLCTTYSLNIDRKNKIVSEVRATKIPKPKGCEAIQDEPISMHLGAGV